MIHRTRTALTAFALNAFALTAMAAPALAQDRPDKTVFDGDFVAVGVGAAWGPSYEGSDDRNIYPVAAITGRVGGVRFSPKGAGLALDVINDPSDAKISFQLGPEGRIRFDRNARIKDVAVQALGKRNRAWEVGGNAGFSINRITNAYDSLSFSVDVVTDVGNAHKSVVITPSMSFTTPLSKGMLAGFYVSADRVGDKFARYYYSVTPQGSIASGLPIYDAKGGWKNVTVAGGVGFDLDGDLTNGGFAVVVGGSYERMLGNFKDSPVVALRGDPNQLIGIVGVGYIF